MRRIQRHPCSPSASGVRASTPSLDYVLWRPLNLLRRASGSLRPRRLFVKDDCCKDNKLIAGFQRGPPDNLELMEDMFEDAHVDGTSAVMPGVPREVPTELVDLVDDEGLTPTPPNVNRKRGVARIAANPGKKKKSPMQQDFKRWIDHCINEDRAVSSSTQVVQGIEAIMEEVVACGVQEGSVEHYIATKLFGKLENRAFFYTMKTAEGRLCWLKMQYEDRKRN